MPKPFPARAGAAFKELKCRPPGVYKSLAAHEYHPDEAASFSKLRKLIVGPAYFWASTPWNSAYVLDGDQTDAMFAGQVYHCRVLEGPKVFAKRYGIAPSKADYPDALSGVAALKAECAKLGLKVGGTIAELSERLKSEDEFDGVLWDEIVAEWESENVGKQKITAALYAKVELAASICHAHPSLADVWARGFPEVSICWIGRDGLPMRCRPDYWCPGEVIEMKMHANKTSQPFHMSCTRTILSEYYHVQAAVEYEGVCAALEMPDELWHGFTPAEIAAYKAAGPPDIRMLMIGSSAPDVWQTIIAPDVPLEPAFWPDGKPVVEVPREPSGLFRSAANIRNILGARFAHYFAHFGRNPWSDIAWPVGLTDRSPGIGEWALNKDMELQS